MEEKGSNRHYSNFPFLFPLLRTGTFFNWRSIQEPIWPSLGYHRTNRIGWVHASGQKLYIHIRPQTNLTFRKPSVHGSQLHPYTIFSRRLEAQEAQRCKRLHCSSVLWQSTILRVSRTEIICRGPGLTIRLWSWKEHSLLELNSWNSLAQVHQKCYMRTTASFDLQNQDWSNWWRDSSSTIMPFQHQLDSSP